MREATLLVIHGPDQGRRYDLLDETIELGRSGHNQIRVLDSEASRRHAFLSFSSGEWTVEDLKSANGTFVNGQKVERAQLQTGDQLQIGRTVFLFSREPIEQDRPSAERINLIAKSSVDDQSRIVGHAGQVDTVALSGWAQAGANLQALYQITEEAVRPTASLDELLQRILDHTLRAVGADRGCMLVADPKTDRIVPRVMSQRPGFDLGERMPVSTSIIEYVIQKGQGVRTSDAQHDSRFEGGQSIVKSGIREAMCVPMQGRYELMGVIYVDTTSIAAHVHLGVVNLFNDSLLRLLLAIGRQSALAIENFRYRDSLVTAERLGAVGQTVTIMSHHIKNILQAVRGGSHLIEQGLKSDNTEMVRNGWNVVERNQERIYKLVMDMLTFSKERQPQLQPARLDEVLQDILDLMRPRLGEEGIACEISKSGSIGRSQFDPEGIHRAVLNVVTNAIDALSGIPNPKIEIRYGHDLKTDLLWVEVEDNGPGIEEADLARLFNLFESTKGSKGTGLGLAVSRKVLQEHGGQITVKSRAGAGACFRLEWPCLMDEQESSDEIPIRP